MKGVILNFGQLGNKCWPKLLLWKSPLSWVLFESICDQDHICKSYPYFCSFQLTKNHVVCRGYVVMVIDIIYKNRSMIWCKMKKINNDQVYFLSRNWTIAVWLHRFASSRAVWPQISVCKTRFSSNPTKYFTIWRCPLHADKCNALLWSAFTRRQMQA